jgi:hypothetical protein
MQNIGSFEVTSNKIIVSDPCYNMETWCIGDFKAMNGKWNSYIKILDKIVVKLLIVHEGYDKTDPYIKLNIDVGVDSGQCGFYDYQKYVDEGAGRGKYNNTNTFYGKVCSLTDTSRKEKKYAGIINNFGVVSSSGYGDGSYDVFVGYDGDQVTIAKLVFTNDEI